MPTSQSLSQPNAGHHLSYSKPSLPFSIDRSLAMDPSSQSRNPKLEGELGWQWSKQARQAAELIDNTNGRTYVSRERK